MSLGSSHEIPLATSIHSGPRAYVPPALLDELRHLDLSGCVTLNGTQVVGLGAYGDVLRSTCIFEDRKEVVVAVKRLRFYLPADINTIFQKEIYVWSKLNHSNVLALLGFTFDASTGFPLLISDWMANGSSWNYVKCNSDCDLMRLISGIAEGLAYLHDKNIVHSDIKPDNIVVTDAGDARICDFGGSRIAAASKSIAKPSTGIRGTHRYLSFELVALPDQYPGHTKESDVWAFGMTVFALIAQEHPYALLGDGQVSKAITGRELPSFDFWTARSPEEKSILRNVCHLSWVHEPERRVNMSFIVTNLRDSRRSKCLSRPSCELDPNGGDAKRRRLMSSESLQVFNDHALAQGVKEDQLDQIRPLIYLTIYLNRLFNWFDSQSEAYQCLKAACKVSTSLYRVISDNFQFDGKLERLMRAMEDAFDFILQSMETRGQNQNVIHLLQQTTECCLFVYQYSQHHREDRMKYNKTIADFISFFVSYKDALASRSSVGPGFVSSRKIQPIDDSVLRRRLTPSETSAHDQPTCLVGTRVTVQEQIIDWMYSASSQRILWLHGVAGSGKSTVSASIADYFRGIYRLGAYLSFKRGKSDPSLVICTIAFKLALFDSTIGSLILAETERNKDITTASLKTQFEKLLVEPLSAATDAQLGPVTIILDALDECGTLDDRKILMQILQHGLPRLPSNFRFLITSRRERDTDRAFSSRSDLVYSFELDYTSKVSRLDVERYMELEIRRILEEEDDVLEDESLRKYLCLLWNNAAGLFIWASTIIKLISESDSPFQRLKELASSPRSPGSLDQLYTTVLRSSGISWRDDTSRTRFQRVIGLILLSKVPLTESTIDAIMGRSVGNCRLTLSRLQSVIDYRPGEPIRLFHSSFSDFLMSSSQTDVWFVDIPTQESFLAMRCFEIMKAELRFNICNLKTSFIYNDSVDDIEGRIESRISPQLSYACRFWSHHLCNITYGSALMHQLSAFLYSHLLYWLEVLSLLKSINIAGPALLGTTRWIENNDAEVVAFARDARRLISIFALPISQSAPHIYLSMLPLMVDESRVSTHYLQHASSMVRVTRRGVKRQSPLLKLLEGHTDRVDSVDFSPDGSLIVSGSYDKTVRIWDTERGELNAGPYSGHVGCIYSISFSPDGARIIVGGYNGIAVLDVDSGIIIVGPFGDECTWSVAVSPDGKHIVSVSSTVIKTWDLESEVIVGEPFVGHVDEVQCIAYSRDGRFIVSGSRDGSVRIWEVESRGLVREPFMGHTDKVNSVAFSPDGKRVVSGSYDRTIRIRDLEKGEVDYSPFIGQDQVISVAYSSDGTRIVSGSYGTVMIWNAKNGQLVAGPFEQPNWVNCVAISPDGTRVVSGSYDGNLRIWDTEIGKIESDSGPESDYYFGVVRFSSDGSCVISDGGTTWRIEDGTVVSKGGDKREYQTLATITDGMQIGFKGTLQCNPFTRKGWISNWRLAVSPNGKKFAFGSEDGMIKVWDKERDVLVWETFDGKGGYISSLTFSPDGKYIVSGSSDIRVWNAETGELLFGPFTGHTDLVNSIAYSPDGKHIASGSSDESVRVWEIETGRSEVFEGHKYEVWSVAFSPDGSLLVSSTFNSDIRVWSTVTSGALIPTVQDPHLASGKTDISKWTLDDDGWIRGAHDELLLWIPLDLRPNLYRLQNIAVFNVEFSTALDFSGSAQGERWHECFQPPV